MKTDTLIKNEGMEILSKYLGMVEAERFITQALIRSAVCNAGRAVK
jgi:hypothetical protein